MIWLIRVAVAKAAALFQNKLKRKRCMRFRLLDNPRATVRGYFLKSKSAKQKTDTITSSVGEVGPGFKVR